MSRPWVQVIDAGEPLSLTIALDCLHRRGLEVISAVGGRRTATALLREGLVSDLYLTTSPVAGGEPHTPLYEGPHLALSRVIAKAGQGTARHSRNHTCRAVPPGQHCTNVTLTRSQPFGKKQTPAR